MSLYACAEKMDPFDGLRGPIPSVVERYYTKYYAIGRAIRIANYLSFRYALDVKGRESEDHCILQHSNRLKNT